MTGIHVLTPDVASRIAAGEVIERPVSVVRELLDNALDAGGRHIAVEIEEGGLKLIRVVDDGCGMPPTDLEVAFERHATSKLATIDDLSSLRTLGFRGEALPSIAAAADVELLSRAADEPVGVQLVLADGRVVKRQAKAAPVGTSIAARDLFARVPARRKFLGAPQQESRQVAVLVAHYALAYPGVAFTYTSNARPSLRTPGDGTLRHAFAAVYGASQAEQMLDLDHEELGVRVCGLASPPGLTRGNRSGISVFVNGRWVQSRSLVFAVVDAYQSQLPVGRYPLAAVDIRIPEEEVDVNVHPAKAEVRFRDERGVGRVLRHAVRAALDHSPAHSWSPPPVPRDADEPELPVSPAPNGSANGSATPQPSGPSLRERLMPGTLRGPQPVQASMPLAKDAPAAPDTAGTPANHSPAQRDVLPLLRVVGQMNATYVVAEGPGGMFLIDQHAAHERVRYDAIVARRRDDDGAAPRQPLLEPVLLELDPGLAATLEEHRERLATLGLDVESFGAREFLVRAIPAGFTPGDVSGAVHTFLEQLANEERVQDPFARAAATVACHSSIRAGQALSMDEMRQLVEDLEATETPRTCPHGRPTLIHMANDAIERQFGRR